MKLGIGKIAQVFGGSRRGLNARQAKALGHVLEHGSLTIQDFEVLCPKVNRRTLQRDLKGLVDKGLLISKGSTNRLIYKLRESRKSKR